ncbi:MAG: hypothetical protein KDA61_06970 [Planctomycetales bacterium]|nr:hypothetical protein [Planctomycetales bacterium]
MEPHRRGFIAWRDAGRTAVQLALVTLLATTAASVGCAPGGASQAPDLIWGEQGVAAGRLQKPRAIAIDAQGRLFLVDMLARIQRYDLDGNFELGWMTPASKNGRPCGLTMARDGDLLVADTHYYRVLRYSPDGVLREDRTIGGTAGEGPGEFGFVTDAVEDSAGNMYVGEYGQNDRIQKFDPEGNYLLQWGSLGEEPGQFRRPQNLDVDAFDRVWAVDACNHRVQVFDGEGRLQMVWGVEGSEPGQLYYPYDLVLDLGSDPSSGFVYVCEYGNNRVQKFTWDGRSVACWGVQGRGPGELFNPWAMARDAQGRFHVVDSSNHRVQRIAF